MFSDSSEDAFNFLEQVFTFFAEKHCLKVLSLKEMAENGTVCVSLALLSLFTFPWAQFTRNNDVKALFEIISVLTQESLIVWPNTKVVLSFAGEDLVPKPQIQTQKTSQRKSNVRKLTKLTGKQQISTENRHFRGNFVSKPSGPYIEIV